MARKDQNENNKLGSEQGSSPDAPEDRSRRELIKGAGLVGATALGAGSTAVIIAQESDSGAGPRPPAVREALEVLTAAEAETLAVLCGRLIPSDQHGPGAQEARAVHFIDHSLASHNSNWREQYRVSLAAVDAYSQQEFARELIQLGDEQQDSVLEALQADTVPGCSPGSAAFFNMLRNHTIDGTFSDPYYGGNRDFVGWDMLNYPGIRLTASETDVAQGADLAPNHQSAYDHDTYTKMASNMASGRGGGDSNA